MRIKSNLQKKFTNVYDKNLFKGSESRSGNGSDLTQTKVLRESLPGLLETFNIKNLLDLPCGDFNWMSQINLNEIKYTGGDVVESMILALNSKYQNSTRKFQVINIVKQVPDKFDAIFCRDLFVHLSDKDIRRALRNIKSSGSTYLFTTTFTRPHANKKLPLLKRGVKWRMINLELPPWKFPEPLHILNENCTEVNGEYKDKSIGIWEVSKIKLLSSG